MPTFFLNFTASTPPFALCRGLEAGEGQNKLRTGFYKIFLPQTTKKVLWGHMGMGGYKKK
jgi:hypothetical protein